MAAEYTRDDSRRIWGEHPKPLTPEQRDDLAAIFRGALTEWERDLRKRLK